MDNALLFVEFETLLRPNSDIKDRLIVSSMSVQ